MLIVVNNGSHFLGALQVALAKLEVAYELVSGYEELTLDLVEAYAGAILTGGHLHVYEREELASLALDRQILMHTTTPVLGICLGHQLIAQHFGGTIQPLLQTVDDEIDVEIVEDDDLFAGLPRHISGRVAHDDAVVAMPPALVTLARSDFGDFEAIRHHSRPVYGLQFHPEASGDAGLQILGNFAALCDGGGAVDSATLQPGR